MIVRCGSYPRLMCWNHTHDCEENPYPVDVVEDVGKVVYEVLIPDNLFGLVHFRCEDGSTCWPQKAVKLAL